jgi:site-specific DNA-methyltransferase (adenine-specific)
MSALHEQPKKVYPIFTRSSMELIQGDCLVEMAKLEDQSVDMVLCDLPYGATVCKWDVVIDPVEMWKQYRRVCRGPVVLTATQPFTTDSINSNRKEFKYSLVWDKGKGSNPLLAKKMPMRSHEDILVFYRKPPVYNPQMTEGKPYTVPRTGGNRTNSITGAKDSTGFRQSTDSSKRYPLSIQKFSIHCGSKLHPSQKPVELMEWLIRTYTNEGDTVLDNAMGSGSCGVACVNTNRKFIGMENDREYMDIATARIKKAADEREVAA